jgi:bla regulator protein BlaR1
MLTNTTEGGATMEMLARLLRPRAGRLVIDKTGLKVSYRITLAFNLMVARGPQTAGDSAPSIFTALQEELGLKLESSRASREVLVIDHMERPTEN